MTHLRKVIWKNSSDVTSLKQLYALISALSSGSRFFGRPPDQLGPEHIRQYPAHLLHKRKLKPDTLVGQVAALRFRTLAIVTTVVLLSALT
jgi:integrase/recombinase XerD